MPEPTRTGPRNPLVDSLFWVLAICATLIFIFPLYWAVSTALRNPADTFTVAGIGIPFVDFTPTLDNFRTELSTPEGFRAMRTSVLVSVSATILALILGMPAAYALARYDFRLKNDLWFWFIDFVAFVRLSFDCRFLNWIEEVSRRIFSRR